MKIFGSLFGGAAKPQGPDPELVAAQRKQQGRLDAQAAEQEAAKKSRQKVLRAQQGQSGFATLFAKTGATGVAKETLGAK